MGILFMSFSLKVISLQSVCENVYCILYAIKQIVPSWPFTSEVLHSFTSFHFSPFFHLFLAQVQYLHFLDAKQTDSYLKASQKFWTKTFVTLPAPISDPNKFGEWENGTKHINQEMYRICTKEKASHQPEERCVQRSNFSLTLHISQHCALLIGQVNFNIMACFLLINGDCGEPILVLNNASLIIINYNTTLLCRFS